GDSLDVLWPEPEATADRVEFISGDDGDLPVLRLGDHTLGPSDGSVATQLRSRLAAAGLLPEYAGCLRRVC
nr:hypothetical protein [Tanacetum cinerariifolium]